MCDGVKLWEQGGACERTNSLVTGEKGNEIWKNVNIGFILPPEVVLLFS